MILNTHLMTSTFDELSMRRFVTPILRLFFAKPFGIVGAQDFEIRNGYRSSLKSSLLFAHKENKTCAPLSGYTNT